MAKRRAGITDLKHYSPAEERKRRGRPSHLADDVLWHRCDRAAGHFGTNWGLYGWDLRRARTASQLADVFVDTEHTDVADQFRPLRLLSTSDFDDLKANRAKAEAIRRELRKAYDSANEIRLLWEQIKHGTATADPGDKLELQLAYERFGREWRQRDEEYKRLCAADDEMRQKIELQEAAFAQSELLLFIRQKRYSFTPIKLANAVAGLPYMTYRQSVRRCQRRPPGIVQPLEYVIFRAIQFLCETARPRLVVTKLREQILQLPRRFRSAQVEFKRNFYLLRKAITEADKTCRLVAQRPYAITRHYDRSKYSQSLIDVIRNYNQQI